MSKKKIRQVRVCLKEHISAVEDMVASMCDKLSDLPDSFRPQVLEGVIYMALFDSGYNDEDFWERVADFLTDIFIEYFETQTEFTDTTPKVTSVLLQGNRLDLLCGSTLEDLLITDVDTTGDELEESVNYVSNDIPMHYQWCSRDDMEYTAELVVEQVAEMFAEYDLASDEDFTELACIIRDVVLGSSGHVDNVDRFTIDMARKRLTVGVNVGMEKTHISIPRLNKFEVDDALSIRNGSRSRRAY